MEPDEDSFSKAVWRPPASEDKPVTDGGRPAAETSPRSEPQLIMRRAVAFIIEFAMLNAIVLPLVWVLAGDRFKFSVGDVELIGNFKLDAAHLVAVIVFLLVRDVPFGSGALAKRSLGLRVVRASDGDASALQRVGRNLTLLLTPLFWLVELATARSARDGRRYGDRMANTKVVDAKPALNQLPWTGILVGAVVGLWVVNRWVAQVVYAALVSRLS